LSDNRRGSGELFDVPVDMVAGPPGTLLVADGRRVIQVDIATGDRAVLLVNSLDPLAPAAAFLGALAYDASRETLYLLAREDRLLQAQLSQASPQISEVGLGTADSASFLDAVFANGRVYAISVNDRTVRAFDTGSGESSALIEWAIGEPVLTALDYDAATNSLVLIGATISRYQLDQSTLEPITQSIPPGAGFALAVTESQAYAVSLLSKEVLGIDLKSGVARSVASSHVATGPAFSSLSGGVYDRHADRLLLCSFDHLASYDLDSATREILIRWELRPVATFKPLSVSAALSFAGDDAVWVSTPSADTVLELDLLAETRREVSGPRVGSGPAFTQITGLAVNDAGSVAYVSDGGITPRILQVDVATGNRTILHELGTSSDIRMRGVLLDEE